MYDHSVTGYIKLEMYKIRNVHKLFYERSVSTLGFPRCSREQPGALLPPPPPRPSPHPPFPRRRRGTSSGPEGRTVSVAAGLSTPPRSAIGGAGRDGRR